jgi:hypothetical protein
MPNVKSNGGSVRRLRVFVASSVVAGILAVCTVVLPDWAEVLFGIEPDARSGSFEAALTLALASIAIVSGLTSIVGMARMRRVARL